MKKDQIKGAPTSFWKEVKDVFSKSSYPKIFPWLQSGLVLMGFTLGVFITVAVYMITDAAGQNEGTIVSESEADKCRDKGGRYDSESEECILVTEDRGQGCKKNSDCEGWCLVDDDAEIGSEAEGTCSDDFTPEGCFKYMDEGKVNSICDVL